MSTIPMPMLLVLFAISPPPGALQEPEVPPGLGVVVGRVTYDGPIPPPVLNSEAGTRRPLISIEPNTNGLSEAAVWLSGVPFEESTDAPAPEELEPVEVDQYNFEFIPHVLTVRAGQRVVFLNNDVANHGVTGSSSNLANRFNVTTPPGGRHERRFAASRQPVSIGCPIHSSMAAWVFAFDHPYHTVTDESGRFRLPPVPPGQHMLHVHHASGELRRRIPVEVRAGETTTVSIDFHAEDRPPSD